MKHKREDLTCEEENILYWVGLLALPALLGTGLFLQYVLLPFLPHMECILWKVFGVYCPGCGGTRALKALLQGRILLSLWYHPVVLYVAVLYAAYILTHTLEKIRFPFVKGIRFRVMWLYGTLVIIGVNFILKNILKFGFGIMM